MVGEVILTSESFEGRQARVSDPWQRENKETREENLLTWPFCPLLAVLSLGSEVYSKKNTIYFRKETEEDYIT